ncbi:phosphoglycolate phosphatase [Rhizobium sp. BK313]|uniref:HAD family hydrolase n=1 Tax=Rhizobium sp. BK313 TaxID=2587081 RepID=UPI00105DA795|nr:HAD family hydrolase [Rhizobium sp. BK313]MBB3452942.1 phosphoglycolate phosphatase [Rhizobium sp. BK313]
MKSPLVVFDLDGTLVDTAPDLISSLNHTIAALDLAPVGYDNLTHLVGHGAQAMIERACRLRGHALGSGDLPPLLQRFIAHYTETMPGDSKPFPGIVNAMDTLKAAGFGLAVCTNKLEKLAVTLIERLNLTHYFDVVTGGDTFAVRKPDAQHLIGTIERAGGMVTCAVMVGDSANDILVAQNAGIPSIAVPFGYSDVGVETLGPSRVIAHYDELTPELVRTLLAA